MRDLIGSAANEPVHLKLNLDVKMQPGLKSGTVWGTLKGTTDENVVVVAHRDGWFEGANDNGNGVATFLGAGGILREDSEVAAEADDYLCRHGCGTTDNGAESGAVVPQSPGILCEDCSSVQLRTCRGLKLTPGSG